jgi:hypothetical protein
MSGVRARSTFALAALSLLALSLLFCGGDDEPLEDPAVPDGGGAAREGGVIESRPADGASGGHQIPVDCPPGTAIEREDNDTPETANEFTELSFCGTITPGTDVDYARFQTPPGKKLELFQAVIDGRVDFELTLGNSTFGPADTARFASGEYLVKIFTTDGEPGTYRFRIGFD